MYGVLVHVIYMFIISVYMYMYYVNMCGACVCMYVVCGVCMHIYMYVCMCVYMYDGPVCMHMCMWYK